MPCRLDMETTRLWHVFLLAEGVVHLLAVAVGLLFVSVFSRLRSVHIHLVLVLDSFVLAFCLTSLFRLHFSLRVVLLNLSADDPSLAFSSTLRDVGMFAGGLHMLLVAAERVVATFRAKSYEMESGIFVVIASVCISWLFSFFCMLFLNNSAASRFLLAGIYLAADVIAISMMYCVRGRSLRLWRDFKGTLGMTHSYQVRENVRTSLFLCRAFGVFALQSIIALIAYLSYAYCCLVDRYPVLLRVSGFIFDVSIAAVPITVSGMICFVHVKLRERMRKIICSQNGGKEKEKVEEMVDFDGKKLAVNPRQETAVYFEQFRTAWA